jgi:hypothetical protein
MGKHLAYVLGPMIKNLEALGYVKEGDKRNIYALPVLTFTLLVLTLSSTIGGYLPLFWRRETNISPRCKICWKTL